MSWQAELAQAAEQARGRVGRVEPWWVRFEAPCRELWATTPAAGTDFELCAVARTLYAMGRTFEAVPSSDARQALVRIFQPQEFLAVEQEDMRLVMASVRRSGCHGTYRKAGTDKEYRF